MSQHIRTNKNICLNCFGNLDENRLCVDCNLKADNTPSPPHHLPPRCVLNGKYLVAKSIGEGGFGITYSAWDLLRGMKVAIKEYYPSGYVNRVPRSNHVIINSKSNQEASSRSLKRFIEEAKVLAKVKNLPGIVSVRDFFSTNGTAYIVMEFLDGISLKKYLQKKGGRLSTDEIIGILRPVMESLDDIHKLGLIHRDISPDNILITKQRKVKLIDFGAAKQSNLEGKSVSIVLKQGFAPEEQYRSKGEQGPWTDVYALAVTIYYSITGQLPPESIQRLFKDTIVRPSELGAAISHVQENALMRALSVYAKNRYQGIMEFLEALTGDVGYRNGAYDEPSPSLDIENVEKPAKNLEYYDMSGKACDVSDPSIKNTNEYKLPLTNNHSNRINKLKNGVRSFVDIRENVHNRDMERRQPPISPATVAIAPLDGGMTNTTMMDRTTVERGGFYTDPNNPTIRHTMNGNAVINKLLRQRNNRKK